MGKVLVLRNCKADMTSSSYRLVDGKQVTAEPFQWPKSGPVEAMDWNPEPKCGGGLHGLLWGDGNWSLLSNAADAVWQVVEVDDSDIVKIDTEKVKFRKGTVIFSGDMGRAVTDVLCSGLRFKWLYELAEEKSSGNYSTSASSGDYSTSASSGYYSTSASSGDSSTSASSGYSSKSASSGNYSTSASSGDSSKSASSGDYSKSEAKGENTIAMVAGVGGRVKVGPNGAFAIAYLDGKNHPRILVGHVGEEGIEADTWYAVENGKLVKA